MGTIHAHEFITVDGSFENPAFTMPYGFTPELGKSLGAITGACDRLLLGRKTWEMFWPSWSTRTAEDDPGVPFFNDSPKHVVTSTLESVDEWQNSETLGGYDADAIRRLKDESEGIYISGSGQLVRQLIADGLLDQLHLLVYPVVLGEGARLFPEGTGKLPLSLLDTESFTNGVVHLTYGPA